VAQERERPELYYVFRSEDMGGSYDTVGTVMDPDTSYEDGGLRSNTTYFYYVTAWNQARGSSGPSDSVSARTYGRPTVPGDVTAEAVDTSRIGLQWRRSGNEPELYYVFRSENLGGGYDTVGTVADPDTSYEDGGLRSRTTYFYYVTAWNTWGSSDTSGHASATTPGPEDPPTVPGDVTAEAVDTSRIGCSGAGAGTDRSYTMYFDRRTWEGVMIRWGR